MGESSELTVLHYVGFDTDSSPVVTTVRTLAAAGKFACVLGVNPDFAQRRTPPLRTQELPALAGDTLTWHTWWRARRVAREVRGWLADEPRRVFHGQSRAALAVAWWLRFAGEKRAVVSVHRYERSRGLIRWLSHRLGDRLFWLTPAMKRYYRVETEHGGWAQCIPPPVTLPEHETPRRELAGARGIRLAGIGPLESAQGWHLVLDGLRALPAEVRARFRFSHLGTTDGSPAAERYAAALKAQTVALGLERLVEWHRDGREPREFLRAMDCLVVPARREPLSIAMLEALALRVPVLAANSGGARDVVVPPCNGWLFLPGEPRDLARTLAMLAASDALQTVRIEPRDLKPFSTPVVAEQWARVYARVLA